MHGADGCCPSTVFFHGGRGCCDVNPTNKLHPLLSTAGKAVPGQDASLAGAFPSEGHQSASSSHPFALPREISRSQPCHVLVTRLTLPRPSCLPLGASAAPTARLPSLPNDHWTEEVGPQPVVAQSNLKAGLNLFAPGRCISCRSDLQECNCWEGAVQPHSMSPCWWGERHL